MQNGIGTSHLMPDLMRPKWKVSGEILNTHI
jgi:hypothetical protein